MIRRGIMLCLGLAIVANAVSQDIELHDPAVDAPYELIEDRLGCLQQTIPLNFNNRVKSFVDYFTVRDRAYTRGIIERKELYFPIFEEVLAERGLPDELKYLSIIESGLRPNAVSRVGAGGLWQFMPSTGKMYRLNQSWYIDERMNPRKATVAASKYLAQLYNMFGDWELALAAYNTGPGNVRKAIRRSGYKKTFWEIYRYLPRETRGYLPQFVAMIYTLNYLDEHNFNAQEIDVLYPMEFDTVQVDHYMHMETLANQLNVCIDDMITLNPQIIRGAIPDGTKGYPLKLPVDKVEFFRENRAELLDSAGKVGKKELEFLARNTPGSTYGRVRQVYRVRSGDVLGTIAQRYHVRISDIKKWNRLNSNLIRVGQRLNIWVMPYYNSKTKETYVVKNLPVKPQPKNGKYHLVQSGDTLWSISKKYPDLSIEKLKKMNNLSTSSIKPGQKLLISM